MDTLNSIKTRRSIRKYKDKPVEELLVEKILTAAMSAPSAYNRRPWEYLIIDERKSLDLIPKYSEHAQMIKQAPLAILICADKDIEPSMEHCLETCSASAQNILLAANDLGLGSVWTGIYPEKNRIQGFKDQFKLPQNIEPIALVVLGYSNEKPKQKESFEIKKIHRNTW